MSKLFEYFVRNNKSDTALEEFKIELELMELVIKHRLSLGQFQRLSSRIEGYIKDTPVGFTPSVKGIETHSHHS